MHLSKIEKIYSYYIKMESKYICKKCNTEFKNKQNLDKHNNKIFKCDIISEFQCNTCNKYFRNKKNYSYHINNKSCSNLKIVNQKNDTNTDFLDSILIAKLSDETKVELLKLRGINLDVHKLSEIMNSDNEIIIKKNIISEFYGKNTPHSNINTGTIKNNTVENSNNNVTNNIQINNFGNEKIDYLDKDYFKDLIMNQHIEKGYVQLIKDIYLNKEHPENKTVKVENINNKYALVFNNDKWDTILKSDLKEMIHKKNYTVLKMHYDKLKKSMSAPKREETYSFLARDETDDPHMMYVIDKIILLFYNDTDNDISNDVDEEIINKKTKNI